MHILLAACFLLQTADGQTPQQRAIAARNKIATASMSVSIQSKSADISTESQCDIWLNSDKLRFEARYSKRPDGLATETLQCLNCYKPGWQVFGDGIARYSIKDVKGKFEYEGELVFDPRLIGYSVASYATLRFLTLDDIYSDKTYHSKFFKAKPIEARLNGRDVILVEYSNDTTGAVCKAYIDPLYGYNMVSLQQFYKDGSLFRSTASEDFRSYNGIWFPTKVVQQTFSKDGDEISSAILKFSNIEINQPIDPISFSLAGLNINDAKGLDYIEANGKQQTVKISGDSVVPIVPGVDWEYPAPTPDKPRRKVDPTYLIAASAALLLLSVILYFYSKRRAA